jgi:flagellar motor component MotA
MITLEEHIMNPKHSSIFSKYPSFINNRPAVEFLCNGLRPIVDGKIKPDQLRLLMETEIESMEEEYHAPVNVLTKAADAMPGFGIVAAVLGIVITMSAIAGPIEQIGEKVAAALVGTFLGIFLSYGFLNPLAVNIEFVNVAELGYSRCIASAVIGFATGMEPIMAVEVARRGLSSDVRPSAEELEVITKQGYPVLGDSGPIQLDLNNSAPLSISNVGEISQGQDVKGKLKLVDFNKYDLLTPISGSYFLAENPGLKPTNVDNVSVRQGCLERGNTSTTIEMA